MKFEKNIAIDQAIVALTSVLSLYVVGYFFSLEAVGDVAYALLICQLCAAPLTGVLRFHATHNRIKIRRFLQIYNSFTTLYFCFSLVIVMPLWIFTSKFPPYVILLYAAVLVHSGARLILFHQGSYLRLVHCDLVQALILIAGITVFNLLPNHPDLIFCWIVSYLFVGIFYGRIIQFDFSKRSFLLMRHISRRYWLDTVSNCVANARSFLLLSILYTSVGSESLGILRIVQSIFGWVGSISTVLEIIIAKFLNRNKLRNSIKFIGLNFFGGFVFVAIFSSIVLYAYSEFFFLFGFLGEFSNEFYILTILQGILSVLVIFNSSLFSVLRLHRIYLARLIGLCFEIAVVFPIFIFLMDFSSAKVIVIYFIFSSLVVSFVSVSYAIFARVK